MRARRPSAFRARAARGLAVASLGLLAAVAPAREVAVTLLHTTDLHGHLLPTFIYTGEQKVGGLLACATLIRDVRREVPNVLLLDAGDLIQGGMESYPSRGALMLEAVDALGYDAWVVGNHEFDWGYRNLARILKGRTTPALGANIGVRAGVPHPLPSLRPHVLREVDGLRVAIIGLTTPGIPSWSLPELIGPLLFERSQATLDRVLPEVRALKPHVMVLLVHQGWRPSGDSFANEVQEIARRFPEIDVLIGGHSHQVVESTLLGRTLYTQAGYHGNWLGRIDLVYSMVQGRLTSLEARLMEVGKDTPPDPELSGRFADTLAREAVRRERVVGHSAVALRADSDLPGQSSMQRLIAEALQARTSADFVIHGAFGDYAIDPGPVTEYDIWRLIPYDNRIALVALTPEEIAMVLDENAAQFDRHSFMGVHGLAYELDPSAPPGQRVSNLLAADGSRLHSRKRYRVALNSYVLASGGQRFPRTRALARRPESRFELTDLETREAVRAFFPKDRPLDLPAQPGVRIKGVP